MLGGMSSLQAGVGILAHLPALMGAEEERAVCIQLGTLVFMFSPAHAAGGWLCGPEKGQETLQPVQDLGNWN